MGGMISLIEAGTCPDLVAGLILVDPALPVVPARADPRLTILLGLYATPGIGTALAAGRRRLPPRAAVAAVLSLCCADPSRVPADVVAWHVDLATQRAGYPEAAADFAAAARSVIGTAGLRGHREYRRRIRAVTCPVLLLHGALDRLVPASAAAAASRSHPEWSVAIVPGAGHVPQLEVPAECEAIITQWISSAGAPALARARAAEGDGIPVRGSGQ